jgi:hypothetical protein
VISLGGGQLNGQVQGLSYDGQIAAGTIGTGAAAQIFQWSSANGGTFVNLGAPPGIQYAQFMQLSRNGAVIVGTGLLANSPYNGVAWRWTQSEGFSIFDTAGAAAAWPTSISADGSVVVGIADPSGTGNPFTAWRWTAAEGVQPLTAALASNFLNPARPVVSADGSTVVYTEKITVSGVQSVQTVRLANGTTTVLPAPNGVSNFMASAVSDDGNTIAGVATGPNGYTVVRWNASTGINVLGAPFAITDQIFLSGDGQKLVGKVYLSSGPWKFWTWNSTTGFNSIQYSTTIENRPKAVSVDATVVIGDGIWRWSEATGTITTLPSLPENSYSELIRLSPDGTAAIGSVNSPDVDHPWWRWTPSTGYLPLPELPSWISHNGHVLAGVDVQRLPPPAATSWEFSLWRWAEDAGVTVEANAPIPNSSVYQFPTALISSDRSAVAIFDPYAGDSAVPEPAMVWKATSGFYNLGPIALLSGDSALSRDGSVVAGFDAVNYQPWVWSSATGAQPVYSAGYAPYNEGGPFVSSDGTVVQGAFWDPVSSQAGIYRWTAGTGAKLINAIPFQGSGVFGVNAMSLDGSTLVGVIGSGSDLLGPPQVWRWTATAGFQILPSLAPNVENDFWAVSSDGSVITGAAAGKPWRWTVTGGMHWVSDDFAPDIFTGRNTSSLAASIDGAVVGGAVGPGPFYFRQSWMAAYQPAIERLVPATAAANAGNVQVSIYGVGFESGASVSLGTTPVPTPLSPSTVEPTRILVTIPGNLLSTVSDFATYPVTVTNPGGQSSKPGAFTIVNSTLSSSIGAVQSDVVPPGGTASTDLLPVDSASAGVSATLDNSTGTAPTSVTAAVYTQNPTSTPGFTTGGGYVDLQVAGATSQDSLTASFYYPSSLSAAAEATLVLMYFDGANWITVLSSGGVVPVKDMNGNRFIVVFDATSTPSLTALSGTVFGLADGAPQVISLTAPTSPVPMNTSVNVGFQISASSSTTAVVYWGDNATSSSTLSGSSAASVSHTYTAAGVYTLVAQLTDQQARRTQFAYRYVVVYDPNGAFVTGGGWVNSPPGAYTADPSLTGKAIFGFVSKYLKGATVPTGNTEFQFKTGNLDFNSTAYQWLVVSGPNAQYKGSGRINGAGNYGFLLTATDGQISGGGGVDKFRIKIWDNTTGAIVYDNDSGASDDLASANPQAIAGGSIVIQKTK